LICLSLLLNFPGGLLWDFLRRHPVAGIDNQNQQKSTGLHPSSSFKNLDQHHNDGDDQQGMKDTAHRVAG